MTLKQVIRILLSLTTFILLYTNYKKTKDPDKKIFGLDFKMPTRVILAIVNIILLVLLFNL